MQSKQHDVWTPPDVINDDEYDSVHTPISISNTKSPPPPTHDNIGWFHGKILVDKSKYIHWANNFRIQFIMALAFISSIVLTVLLAPSSSSIGLLTGGSLTIITCTAVIYTYMKRSTWRKHPNPFIFYRSVCDLCLVLCLLITELYSCTKGTTCEADLPSNLCTLGAGVTQFFLFASESWFFVMAIDMWQSLRSPFTDYKQNKRYYNYFVWGVSLLTSILIMSIPDTAGPSEFGYCWTRLIDDDSISHAFWSLNVRSWLLFYIWLIIYWIYAIGVVIFAWNRLNAGLNETLRMRLRVLHSVTLYVIAIIIYWALSFSVYVPYQVLQVPSNCNQGNTSRKNMNCSDDLKLLNQLMSFMITCKGYFDFVVWFQINELTFSNGLLKQDEGQEIDVDVDLNPQVNLALRCEVLYYTTTGIIQAVKDTHHLPPGATQQALYLQPQGVEKHNENLGQHHSVTIQRSHVSKKRGTLFTDFCPHTFRTIREHFGLSTEEYISSLQKTTKERLSEGASGAFMFYSHDLQLIVKSMSSEEARFLKSIAADYAAYLITHPDSLLTRFFGCHSIRLYGSLFHFVVMQNLFYTEKVIHRRYDIKGSYVNRSTRHPSKGSQVTCRHCNGAYVFGSTTDEGMTCPLRVGSHEPNSVLKDNDLTSKVRLDADSSEELFSQLKMDANFLARLGIMDYSLLLGVHNIEYVVDVNPFGQDAFSGGGGRARRRSSVSVQENRTGTGSSSQDSLPRIATGTRKAHTVVGPSCYYFGMIDILQTWNLEKRVERLIKVNILQHDGDGISAVPPTIYKDRFILKMADILGIALHNEDHHPVRQP